MFKRARLYAAISLLVQSVTFIALTIIFLFRNKKNTAGAFCAMGILGGIAGSILLCRQFKEQFKDTDILAVIDDLCDNPQTEPADLPDIPVDDSASESEFAN